MRKTLRMRRGWVRTLMGPRCALYRQFLADFMYDDPLWPEKSIRKVMAMGREVTTWTRRKDQ